MYPMMIPFVDKGADQLAKRIEAWPVTGDNEKYGGDEGTKKKNDLIMHVTKHVYNIEHCPV